jgi:hypothetical protein
VIFLCTCTKFHENPPKGFGGKDKDTGTDGWPTQHNNVGLATRNIQVKFPRDNNCIGNAMEEIHPFKVFLYKASIN